MAKPYSMDLRMKVMKLVDKGEKVAKISKMFDITSEAIYQWIRKRKKTGNFAPESGYQKGHGHKVKDIKKFIEFVKANPNKTVRELGMLWPEKMSGWVTCLWLKKAGFTYKKKHFVILKETKQKD